MSRNTKGKSVEKLREIERRITAIDRLLADFAAWFNPKMKADLERRKLELAAELEKKSPADLRVIV